MTWDEVAARLQKTSRKGQDTPRTLRLTRVRYNAAKDLPQFEAAAIYFDVRRATLKGLLPQRYQVIAYKDGCWWSTRLEEEDVEALLEK